MRAAAELLNIEFDIISTLGRATEATITLQNFAPQGRVYLGQLAENRGEHYVVLNPVENPDISNESFDSEVKKTTNKSILNPVENFNNPNESAHFKVEKYTEKTFSNLPPELVEKELITAIRICDNTWFSQIFYTLNSLRNVCNFWRALLDGFAVTKLLPQVYVSQDIPPKPKRNGEAQVNMQRIIRNAGSFSGVVINLKKILNIERRNKAWIELCLLSYGWYIIKNVWRRTKK